MWGYNKDVPGYAYDVELAKKLLAEAGFPEGKGLPEVMVWSMPVPRPYNPEGLKVGVAMIGDLKKVGIQGESSVMTGDLSIGSVINHRIWTCFSSGGPATMAIRIIS